MNGVGIRRKPASRKDTGLGLSSSSQPLSGLLQRKCACGGSPGAGGECAECQKKRLNLQRKEAGSGAPATAPPIVHEVLSSPGRPLDREVRSFMEPRLGHDFSRVRVHTDSRAAESAQAISAAAYAVGRDVVFARGAYAPESGEGRKLLAHELTHVVQQGEVAPAPTGLRVLSSSDPTEGEADRASRVVMEGQGFTVASKADGAIVARDEGPQGESPERCSVAVRATAVGGAAGLIGFKHLFIVCTDSRGIQTGYRAGPGGTRDLGLGFGTIAEDHGKYDATFPDWDPSAPSVKALEGSEACGKIQCILDEIMRIDKAAIPYWITGPNSNTVASSVLSVCGIPRKKPDVIAPGWGDPIINLPRIAAPAPAPGGFTRPTPPPPKP